MGKFPKYLAFYLLLIIMDAKHFCFALEDVYLCNKENIGNTGKRILGGDEADMTQFKFMAGVVVKNGSKLRCGSSIITTQWAITAAHCLGILKMEGNSVDDIYVSSGNKNWRKGYKHDVLNIIPHDMFDEESFAYDAALIKVKQPFNRRGEGAISLASKNYPYTPNTAVIVLGWGVNDTKHEDAQEVLRYVDISIISQTECNKLYQQEAVGPISDSQFCAGSAEGKDACHYDSGGPLVDKGILIGINSWGIDCGKKETPGVYTKVSLLEKWLIETSKKLHAPINTTCVGKRSSRRVDVKPSMRKSGSKSLKNLKILIQLQVLMVFVIMQ